MARAKEVQAKLPENNLSFTKIMLPSHVIRGFWLVSCYCLLIIWMFDQC